MTNEELEKKVKKLEEQITNLRIKILESKAEEECFLPYKPYEVNVPEDIGDYYYISGSGHIDKLWIYNKDEQTRAFKRGLTFKTREEVEQFDKERKLLFKLRKWAEEHADGWTPNWEDIKEEKWSVMYDDKNKELETYVNYKKQDFLKLPYFKTQELAEQFIEEFGEEIKEVLL